MHNVIAGCCVIGCGVWKRLIASWGETAFYCCGFARSLASDKSVHPCQCLRGLAFHSALYTPSFVLPDTSSTQQAQLRHQKLATTTNHSAHSTHLSEASWRQLLKGWIWRRWTQHLMYTRCSCTTSERAAACGCGGNSSASQLQRHNNLSRRTRESSACAKRERNRACQQEKQSMSTATSTRDRLMSTAAGTEHPPHSRSRVLSFFYRHGPCPFLLLSCCSLVTVHSTLTTPWEHAAWSGAASA